MVETPTLRQSDLEQKTNRGPSPRSRCRLKLFIVAAFPILSLLFFCGSAKTDSLFRPGVERLEIVTASIPHNHVFQIAPARTAEQMTRGLMFRPFLPEDEGMLFGFGAEDILTMWMKNTCVPLDMIFISHDGRIVSIRRNAVPMSEEYIQSGQPAIAVLEVNAGTAQKIGLSVGDVVRHPMFQR
jgi:uncharacterized membrane protein (UPF0127 family)